MQAGGAESQEELTISVEIQDLLEYNDDVALARNGVVFLNVCCEIVVSPQYFWLSCARGIGKQRALGGGGG